MNNRMELSFKNMEVRIYALIMGPTVIAGFVLLYLKGKADNEFPYQLALLTLLLGSQVIYYSWRFWYRKKQNVD